MLIRVRPSIEGNFGLHTASVKKPCPAPAAPLAAAPAPAYPRGQQERVLVVRMGGPASPDAPAATAHINILIMYRIVI